MLQTVILILSYLLGSVPFGLILVKALKGIDIRDYGSGNIGATNVQRVLGTGPFIIVLLLDASKGFLPVFAAAHIFPATPWMAVGAGVCAILGHNLSVFLRFSGGKGVATSLGVIIGLSPIVAAIGFGIWLLIVAVTRYVSLASVLACTSAAILMFFFPAPDIYRWFVVLAAIFVIAKHRSNIARLMQGREHKWGERVKVSEEG